MFKSLKNLLRITFFSAGVIASGTFAAHAKVVPAAPEIAAKAYVLMDYDSGQIIVSSNENDQLGPASLTKMMTSYILGLEIKSGNVSPEDLVTVSEEAWAANPKFKGSSLMFIEVGTTVKVDDLNRGIIITSGNDACVAIAEHLAGSEDSFASLMNSYADKLGMYNSHFMNSHGLPHTDHYTSALDMATLARAIIHDVPEEYAIYSEKVFKFNNIKQYNRNSLLWDKSMQVDGMKTGHTNEAGYSLVSSGTKDGGMRLISVVMGTKSEQARKAESKKLLNYGFRFFESAVPYRAGDSLVNEKVWLGDIDTVELGVMKDVAVTIPRGSAKQVSAEFQLTQALQAPLTKGSEVGTVHIMLEGEEIATVPLVVMQDVVEGSWFSQIVDHVLLMFED